MSAYSETRFRCIKCGKLTAGRVPREAWHRGDGSGRLPRRHYVNGKLCEGVYHEAEWVEVPRAARDRSKR